MPIILIICFILLFYYLGYSFLAGVVVLVSAFLTNLFIGRIAARYYKKYMSS